MAQRYVRLRCVRRKIVWLLLTAPQGLHKNRKLHINSAANYWSTFRASIHIAYRDRKIKENPNGFLERIETIPTDKEHLSQDEVIRLASTPCSAPALKRAFLFSCLTALRKSDIKKLTWEEIQPYGSDGVMLSLIKTTFFLYFSLAYALFAQTDLFRSYHYFLSVCHPKHR